MKCECTVPAGYYIFFFYIHTYSLFHHGVSSSIILCVQFFCGSHFTTLETDRVQTDQLSFHITSRQPYNIVVSTFVDITNFSKTIIVMHACYLICVVHTCSVQKLFLFCLILSAMSVVSTVPWSQRFSFTAKRQEREKEVARENLWLWLM